MARPTSLTPTVRAAILEAVRAGNYKATACAAAGIHRDTLNGWELRGRTGEEPYASFVEELEQAEAQSEIEMLSRVRNAEPSIPEVKGADPWQATAWAMERRFPKRWAQRVRAAVTEELDAFTDRLAKKLDEATMRRVLEAAREDAPGEGAGTQH